MTAIPRLTARTLRDQALAGAAADLLTNDSRLTGSAVAVSFDDGVAHLTGDVDTPAELRLVRELVGRLGGVYAVWDRVRIAGRAPLTLDLGCGDRPQYQENIGIDRRQTRSVTVVADLAHGVPVATGSVDRVFVIHLLEHLNDFLPLVDECHRILQPGGILHVLAPWWGHVNAVADPTHVRLLDVQTIKGICNRVSEAPRWYPLHAACDGTTVFADLTPLQPGDPDTDPVRMARFFD